MKKMILAILLLLIWGCGDAAPDAAQTDTTMPAPSQNSQVTEPAAAPDAMAGASGDERSEFVPLGMDQIDSPFTRETVIKLNAIVQKSLDIIEEFDDEIPGIRDAVTSYREENMAEGARIDADKAMASLGEMHNRSKQVLVEIKAAEAELMASGEVYNDAILAAMVGFVADVELELSDEIDLLTKELKGG